MSSFHEDYIVTIPHSNDIDPRILIFIVILVFLFIYKRVFCKEIPNIIYRKTATNVELLQGCQQLKEYEYPLWGRSRHIQTCYVTAFRLHPKPEYKREYLDTEDGGVIVLDFVNRPTPNPTDPVVVILPGICSTSNANYIRCFATQCAKRGFQPVVYIPRGCDIVKSPRIFTLGGTKDLRQTLVYLKQKYPLAPIMGVGFSLGANPLVKYLGEYKDDPIVSGAVAMAQGFDAVKGIEHIKTVPFYEKGLIFRLTSTVKRHSHIFNQIVDVPFVLGVKSVEDFDANFTCKIHGYKSTTDYYREHSCVQWLKDVSVPLLLMNAMDDPLFSLDQIPVNSALENENLLMVLTKHGGHLGWCQGFILPSLVHWHDKVAVEFVETVLRVTKKY